jgi:hypothetical protein
VEVPVASGPNLGRRRTPNGVEAEQFAQRRVGGVHRLGERELAPTTALIDEGLGSLRRGLAGEELAQPVAADDLGADHG